MALLGSSWSLLGRSGPKMGPNMVAKLIKKLVQKLSKKISKMGALLGFEMGFKFSLYRDRRAKAFSTIEAVMLIFFIDLESHFGSFGCLLGAFLGFLRFSWEVSGPKNVKKTVGFLRVLKRLCFGL